MKNEDERYEYCINESGIIYRGSSRRISGKQWNFGQVIFYKLSNVFEN